MSPEDQIRYARAADTDAAVPDTAPGSATEARQRSHISSNKRTQALLKLLPGQRGLTSPAFFDPHSSALLLVLFLEADKSVIATASRTVDCVEHLSARFRLITPKY
jgi:hypothetical protein